MRLEALAAERGDQVEIEWRSFLLRPEPEQRTIEQFTKYTTSWARPAETEPMAGFVVPWSGEHPAPTGSMEAAIAGKVAESFGPQAWDRFHHGLLNAYFVEHRTVSDPAVHLEVAQAAGIDGDEFARRLTDQRDEFHAAVIDDHNAAVNAGISGIPAVVVDDKYLVSGAVDTSYYERVIDHVLSERGSGDAQSDN